jgi:hypothetical protein
MVNLQVIDHNGNARSETSVSLSAIDELLIVRGPVRPKGLMAIELRELGEFHQQRGLTLDAPQPAANPF